MRFAYGFLMFCLWFIVCHYIGYTLATEGYNQNAFIISLAIVTAGAMAGGDGD